MTLREATEADTDAVAHLMTQLGYPTTPADMRTRLTAVRSHPDYATFVAAQDQRLAGMVGACLGHYYEYNGVYGRIVALVVDAQVRGAGVGAALLAHAEDWIRHHQGSAVIINSGHQRTEAHRFYEGQGYQATGQRFVKALDVAS